MPPAHTSGLQPSSTSHLKAAHRSSEGKKYRSQADPTSSHQPSRRKRSTDGDSSDDSLYEARLSSSPSQRRRITLRSATGASATHLMVTRSTGHGRAASNYQAATVVNAGVSNISIESAPIAEQVPIVEPAVSEKRFGPIQTSDLPPRIHPHLEIRHTPKFRPLVTEAYKIMRHHHLWTPLKPNRTMSVGPMTASTMPVPAAANARPARTHLPAPDMGTPPVKPPLNLRSRAQIVQLPQLQ